MPCKKGQNRISPSPYCKWQAINLWNSLMQGSKTKSCGWMILQPLTTLTVTQNPAVKGQPKATILGCNLFASGSGKDTPHWWHPTQTHVQTDRQTQLGSNLQKLALKKFSMSLNACDIYPFARKERLAVHCYLVRHVSHHQEKGTH